MNVDNDGNQPTGDQHTLALSVSPSVEKQRGGVRQATRRSAWERARAFIMVVVGNETEEGWCVRPIGWRKAKL